ncbi:MAG: hypothetical protein U9P90_03135, partial [Patescibacteria group bacterium]|nr:hypothetical protein [Patescibacteria group bacterium]
MEVKVSKKNRVLKTTAVRRKRALKKTPISVCAKKTSLKLQAKVLRSNIGRRSRRDSFVKNASALSSIKSKSFLLGGVVLLLVLVFVFWGNNIWARNYERLVKANPISYYDVNAEQTVELPITNYQLPITEETGFPTGNTVSGLQLIPKFKERIWATIKFVSSMPSKIVVGAKTLSGFAVDTVSNATKVPALILVVGDTIEQGVLRAELSSARGLRATENTIAGSIVQVKRGCGIALRTLQNNSTALWDYGTTVILDVGDGIEETVSSAELAVGYFLFDVGDVVENIEFAIKSDLKRDAKFVLNVIQRSPQNPVIQRSPQTTKNPAGVATTRDADSPNKSELSQDSSLSLGAKKLFTDFGNAILEAGFAMEPTIAQTEYAIGSWVLDTGWAMEKVIQSPEIFVLNLGDSIGETVDAKVLNFVGLIKDLGRSYVELAGDIRSKVESKTGRFVSAAKKVVLR